MIFKELDVTGLIDFDEENQEIDDRDFALFYAGMKYIYENPKTPIDEVSTRTKKDGFEYIYINGKPFYLISVSGDRKQIKKEINLKKGKCNFDHIFFSGISARDLSIFGIGIKYILEHPETKIKGIHMQNLDGSFEFLTIDPEENDNEIKGQRIINIISTKFDEGDDKE